jgi:hypothetical protein
MAFHNCRVADPAFVADAIRIWASWCRRVRPRHRDGEVEIPRKLLTPATLRDILKYGHPRVTLDEDVDEAIRAVLDGGDPGRYAKIWATYANGDQY